MIKFDNLLNLEKTSNIDIRYCDIISDVENEAENIRTNILQSRENGKYYFYQMQHGNIIKCFEIALSWRPFEGVYIFNYTPDNLHRYEIDSRNPGKHNPKKLEENQIVKNMTCSYNGITVEYVNENELKFNEKPVKIENDLSFTYSLMKSKIKASGGAKGLYIFLENIAEEGKHEKYPLFRQAYDNIRKLYLS